MRKSILTLSTVLLLVVPSTVEAQRFGVAGRVGTLGLGGEVALGLTDRLVVRGGLGFMQFEPTATVDDIDFTLTLPETWTTIGADVYLNGSFRIGGGVLFKSDTLIFTGEVLSGAEIEIGDEIYSSTDVSQLTGILRSRDQAPYVLIGFGRHTAGGVGLFLDVGAAFIGEPVVTLTATGDPAIVGSSEFQSELRKQEQNIEDDLGSYIKVWPILNLGLRIGVGG
jgi:hypothetical protein